MKRFTRYLFFLAISSASTLALSTNTEGVFEFPCLNCGTEKNLTQPISISLQEEAALVKQDLDKPFSCDKQTNEGCLLIQWLKLKHSEYSSCRGFFINEEGHLGVFSRYIANLILDDVKAFGDKSVFVQNSPDYELYCPQYRKFTLIQKIAFHGWIFELTAFPESDCNVKVKANPNAPTTAAVCMYQLEGAPSIRKWRSKGFVPARCAVSYKQLLTMEGCTGCAFDEYKRKFLKDGTPFGVFNEAGKKVSGSYWASQNPLPPKAEKCLMENREIDKKTGKPRYLEACKSLGAHREWIARLKFFDRLPRFPLCGTGEAQYEIQKLKEQNRSL